MWDGISRRLEGRLVVLEPLERAHEEALYRAASDPEVWRWMDWNAAADQERFRSWMDDGLAATEAGEEAVFATCAAADGAVIGSTRYMTLRPEHRGLEIGWTWLTPSAWQTGANVESKLLLLEHAFERLGCIRVEFKTNALNERSRAALAALPARFEGIFRKHRVLPGGGVRDSAYYSIVDDEWPDVRLSLGRRLAAKRG